MSTCKASASESINLQSLTKELELFDVCGVARPELSEATIERFQTWLKNHKASGLQYLERRKFERCFPHAYFPQVKSVLCFGEYYFPGWSSGDIKISNYAWAGDYHLRLKEKLELMAKALQEKIGAFQYRACVDTSPLLEKAFAVQAGLGWQGKNSLLLNRNYGSYLFLGELLTDVPYEAFLPSKAEISTGSSPASLTELDRCGTCRKCIEVCPTEALTPYVLDSKRCISYWNLEHRGEFTNETPPFHGWLAGCDLCQEVCPWNQKLIPLKTARPFADLQASDIHSPDWTTRISKTALSFLPQKKWTQNLTHLLKPFLMSRSK